MLNVDPCVFLLDVDNTLLDNDRFAADLRERLTTDFGAVECERYWSIYARLRDQLGYADYLAALQEFRVGLEADPDLLQIAAFVLDYPFSERFYPAALDAIAHLRTLGTVAILSDGDIVFQPRKIQRSGIWAAVDGHVLIFLHKERMLEAMQQRFPAARYVMIDDKANVLAAMKRVLGDRLTTVFVRQGHYAAQSAHETLHPPPDRTINSIGEVCMMKSHDFAAAPASVTQEHA